MTKLVLLEQTIEKYREDNEKIKNGILKYVVECPREGCSYTDISTSFVERSGGLLCPNHNQHLVEIEVREVEADTTRLYDVLKEESASDKSVIFIYDHEGPSTRFGSFQEDMLTRYLFGKPVLIVDKDTTRPPELNLENNPMRKSVEGMGKSFYQRTKIDSIRFLKETGLHDRKTKRKIDNGETINVYYSTSLRVTYPEKDRADARRSANYVEEAAREAGLNLKLFVPTLVPRNEFGYCNLDEETKSFLLEGLEESSDKYQLVSSGRVKLIDRDMMAIEKCDFLWLNIPKVEDMYKTEETDIIDELREDIANNRLKYDPVYSYSGVTALALARCFVPTIILTRNYIINSRLDGHLFNFESDTHKINQTNIVYCTLKDWESRWRAKKKLIKIIERYKLNNSI